MTYNCIRSAIMCSLLVSHFLLELPQTLFLLLYIVVLFTDLRYALTLLFCGFGRGYVSSSVIFPSNFHRLDPFSLLIYR